MKSDEIAAAIPNPIGASSRQVAVDKKFASNSKITTSFANYFFQRLVAKQVIFEGVDFTYTIFDTCYLRKCVFQNCDFTGCRFTATNLVGSSFIGCKFDYAVFERTVVDSEILDVGCPGHENVKLKFARTLRTNFQSIGDAASVNKAIKVELDATREHFWKGWKSPESYYRSKYRGWSRLSIFVDWLNFNIWDYVWGNGESLWKLARAIVVLLVAMTVADVWLNAKNHLLLTSYAESFVHAPTIFFGIKSPQQYPAGYLTMILVVRLIMVGFLLSIIIKRFSRR